MAFPASSSEGSKNSSGLHGIPEMQLHDGALAMVSVPRNVVLYLQSRLPGPLTSSRALIPFPDVDSRSILHLESM